MRLAWAKDTEWGDLAYRGQRMVIRRHVPKATDFVSPRYRGAVDEVERAKNRTKSKVGAKVEHPIGVIRQVFGLRQVAYRGLKAENRTAPRGRRIRGGRARAWISLVVAVDQTKLRFHAEIPLVGLHRLMYFGSRGLGTSVRCANVDLVSRVPRCRQHTSVSTSRFSLVIRR
jgi:hypothetical protein